MNFEIHFDIPLYLFIMFGAASAGLSFLMYRNIGALSLPRKSFLGVLRGASLLLLMLAMTNLVTNFVRFDFKKKDVLLLIDDSKSMSLREGTASREQAVHAVLGSAPLDTLKRYFEINHIVFGGGVLHDVNADSLRYDQPATNIAAAVERASRDDNGGRTAFAVLVTDGDYNEGGNPVDAARSLQFPLFTIGVGDSTMPKDIVVKQVIPAPEIYAGKKSVVKAIVGANGYGSASASAQLLDDGREVDSREVTLPAGGDVEISFDYTPSTPGTHVLSVHVSPMSGEFSLKNNSAFATAEVKKGKYSVLLVAGEPATDVAFLRRNIEEGGDFDLKVLVQRTGDNFYEKDAASILAGKYDAAVLYDFPNGESAGTAHEVADKLAASGLPYAYFAGTQFSPAKVGELPRLPFSDASFQPGEFQVGVSPAGDETLPLSLQPLYTLIDAGSAAFPPLYYQRIMFRPSPGSVTLASAVMAGVKVNAPLFVVDPAARSAAFLAYGLWRLQLMSSLSGLRSDFLHQLTTTLLRTLISGGKQKLLSVQTDKKVYDPSESVRFNALLVGQGGAPLDGADVAVTLKDGAGKIVFETRLAPRGGGGYSGSVSGLGEGKYSYVAGATSGSAFLGADSGSVVVEPLNIEFVRTAMNAPLLRQMASVSGGEFFTPSQFVKHGIDIPPSWKEPSKLSRSTRFEILSSLPVLALVFLLLVVEWTFRKLWGLP